MNNIQNPWKNVSWDNPFADGDKGYIVKIGKQEFEFGSKEYVNAINASDEEKS